VTSQMPFLDSFRLEGKDVLAPTHTDRNGVSGFEQRGSPLNIPYRRVVR
jgi:hypothetical protein